MLVAAAKAGRMRMRVNIKDFAAGGLFIAIGAWFAQSAWFNLKIGRAFNMGPGYFPVVLGLILIGFGAVIAISAINKPQELIGRVSWRGLLLVIGGVAFFGATVRGLGLPASLGGTTFLAAMSTGRTSWLEGIILSVVMAAFCTLLFIYGLGLPYRVLGPWLGGYE
jgi:hypothetical protein